MKARKIKKENENQAAHLAALQAALIQGEKSGKPTSFDFDSFIVMKRASAGARVKPNS